MASNAMSPNHREALTAVSSITGKDEYLLSTNGVLDVGATFSGSSIAINDGVTTSRKASVLNLTNSNPITVAITDGSGNQITSFGGTGGTSSSFNSTFPTTGTAAGASDGTNMKPLLVDSAGNLKAGYTAVVNAANSSTATLTANSTFTGTGVSVLPYSRITVQVDSNQNSATNGVQLQFSEDNSSWTDASTFTYTVGTAPNHGQIYGVSARGQYFRVVYTNGGTGQTNFALQTVLHPHNMPGDLVTMTTVPNSTNHALLSKSSIVGLTTAGGGGFVDVKVNPSGTLTVDASNSTNVGVTGTIAATQSGTWTVTANAGTNLNTSALALESGGNLASIKTDVDNLNLAQGSTTSGQKGNLILGAVTTAAPTYTTAQSNPLSLTTAGALRVDGSATTQPISGTVTANAGTGTFNIQANASVNLNQVAGASVATGHGTASGAIRVELPTDGTGVVGLNSGTNTIGDVNLTAAARGGYSVSSQTALTTTATVSGTPGKFGGVMFINLNSSPAYIQVFDTTGAVTLGTTTPTFVIPLPANSTAANGVAAVHEFSVGIAISSGIKVAATTTATGSTTVSTGLTGFVMYK